MLFLMQSQVTGSLPADEPVAEACSQLNALFLTAFETGEAMPIPDFSVNNLDVKSDDVCRLLSGQRMFGVPSVIRDPQDATDSTESKTSGRKPTPLLQYLTLQSQDLKNTRPRPTVPKRASLALISGVKSGALNSSMGVGTMMMNTEHSRKSSNSVVNDNGDTSANSSLDTSWATSTTSRSCCTRVVLISRPITRRFIPLPSHPRPVGLACELLGVYRTCSFALSLQPQKIFGMS